MRRCLFCDRVEDITEMDGIGANMLDQESDAKADWR